VRKRNNPRLDGAETAPSAVSTVGRDSVVTAMERFNTSSTAALVNGRAGYEPQRPLVTPLPNVQ